MIDLQKIERSVIIKTKGKEAKGMNRRQSLGGGGLAGFHRLKEKF